MNSVTFWRLLLGSASLILLLIAVRIKTPLIVISVAGLSAYAGTAIMAGLAFLLLPKNRKMLAAKILVIIGLGFLVHRFMTDVDQSIRQR